MQNPEVSSQKSEAGSQKQGFGIKDLEVSMEKTAEMLQYLIARKNKQNS